ncbi:MAG: ion channel [Polyangiaceae bacterium]
MAPPAPLNDDVARIGTRRNSDDAYHMLLAAPWSRLFVGVIVGYVVLNGLFAFLYVQVGGIENASGSYLDAYFFSVQTMATIGYGKMVPVSVAANTLVTIEALVGLVGFAMATAVMFAKFSRPTSKVLFSKNIVVARRDGHDTLQFRMANERAHGLVEASLRVVLLRNAITPEGERVRRFHPLELMSSQSAMFNLTWTAVHRITETSPFFGRDKSALIDADDIIVATLVGIDGLSGATSYARCVYRAGDVVLDHRFVDIIGTTESGQRAVYFNRFHDIEPDAARR